MLEPLTTRGLGPSLMMLAGLALSSCSFFGAPETINPPTAAFVVAIEGTTKAVRADPLTAYRRTLRRDMFVNTVLSALGNPPVTPQWLAGNAPGPENWLCRPQYAFAQVAIPLAALDGLGKTLAGHLEAPSDDIGALIRALGTDYAIAPLAVTPKGSYDQWINEEAKGAPGALCRSMVADGDPYFVRLEALGTEEAGAISAIIALGEALWSIGKPVAVGILKNVDMERNAEAIRDYFKNPDNIKSTKDYIERVETFTEREFAANRRLTAGRASGAVATLFDGRAPHWTEFRDIAAQKCKGFSDFEKASAARVFCMDAVMAAVAAPLNRALDAADAFDAASLQRLPETRLSSQLDTLHDIANGRQADEAKVKAMWTAALRYIALFQTVENAASTENRKKIKDAWETFRKALENDG